MAEHLVGGLHRCRAAPERLAEIGLDHRIDLRLVVLGRDVAAAGAEEVQRRVELAVVADEARHSGLV